MKIRERLLLSFLLFLAAGVWGAGINWGLPGRDVDRFLFGDRRPWTGKEILDLLPPDTDENRGADVDANPIGPSTQPVLLNGTDQQRAEIVRRYRLFSYQPDEMITLMSLAKMKPSQGQLDPRLYQYGGLWIYPVGAMLKASWMAGLVRLESDQAFYLDHPAEFGKFYVVMRVYVLMWGLVGVWAIYWIARKLDSLAHVPLGEGRGEDSYGSYTSIGSEKSPHPGPLPEYRVRGKSLQNPLLPFVITVCFIFLPVVVNSAHEAKPHLPAAVLTLLAIIAGYRFVETGKTGFAILAGILCGGAFGMLISGVTSFILLPSLVLMRKDNWRRRVSVCVMSIVAGLIVYAITNPYVIIHLLADRSTLLSNLGNSKAMYAPRASTGALFDAFIRLSEGCSLPLLIAGIGGAVWSTRRSHQLGMLMAIVCAPILIQFALLAQGKPSEYARFALLPCICLAICGVRTLANASPHRAVPVIWALMIIMGVYAASYVWHFGRDSISRTPRIIAAERLQKNLAEGCDEIFVRAEPAPYCLPPVDLFRSRITLNADPTKSANGVEIRPVDLAADEYLGAGFQIWPRPRLLPTPISWASKPMRVIFWREGHPKRETP